MATRRAEKKPSKIHCVRCNRMLNRNQFYMDKNRRPMEKCKKCLTSMVNLDSESTILPILKEVDIPYIPSEFKNLVERYGGTKNSNQTVVGRYIGKMKLAQYKDYTYADTERLVEEEEKRMALMEDKKEQKIEEFIQKGMDREEAEERVLGSKELEIDFGDLFTKEEKKALMIKWGKHYKPEELMQLETFYTNMHASFDISTASHEDYLLQIAKISLRMHDAINIGDIETHKNLANTYDKLMKSVKFTAIHEEEDRFVDSISEITKLCETEGFIPVYHTDEPQDVVDVTIRDLKMYTRNLVENEHNLGDMIESSMELIKIEEEKDALDDGADGEMTVDSLFETTFLEKEEI